MIAHPLRRSRATSDQINLLHTAFFFLFCFSNPSHFGHLHAFLIQTTSLPPISFSGVGKEHVPAAPAPSPRRTCVGAQVPLERGVAGEGAVALAADVAAHPGVHLHVLLQGALRLEPLAAQQAEHGHVCTCARGTDPA